jgi:large subunit ribosomal protein L24e
MPAPSASASPNGIPFPLHLSGPFTKPHFSHKNFKMKRNPRKLGWTKSFRHAHNKELTVDTTLQFAARRNVPVRYNRDLIQTTLKAMSRVSEIRSRRERAFYKARMRGNKERQRADDRKLVEENQHLLPPSERWEVNTEGMEVEVDVDEVKEKVEKRRREIAAGEESELDSDLEETLPKVKNKRKLKMKVGGGIEAMDVDE